MARSEVDKQIEEAVEGAVFTIGRLLSGRDMDGEQRTNATFLRSGTRVRDGVQGRVGPMSYRPGWQRAAARVTTGGALGVGGWAYWLDPEQTLQALQYGGAAAGGLVMTGGMVHAVRTRGRRELMREWVMPLHLALAEPLGLPLATRPRTYLHVPANFSDDDAEIRIDLPVNLKFNESAVAEMIVKKLALQGVSFSWKYDGRAPYVTVKKVNRPPSKVVFADAKVRELVAKVPESAPLIGLTRGGKVVSVDLDTESPHVLVSAGTGGGKSVILRTIASQLIHHGALGYILDFKRVSHLWARGVPNVTYCRDISDIHEALIYLGEEGKRRIHAAEKLADGADAMSIGPRLVILLEEINATMKQLTRYWEKIKEKGDPKVSPAVDALAEILFMGRAVRLHVLLVAQSATARALGGPEMRENFATRILARYTQNAWRMLVPEVQPAPKSTRHIGRAQVVLGGISHETQIMFMTDADARAWAVSGAGRPPSVALKKGPAEPPVGASTQVHRYTDERHYQGKQGVQYTGTQVSEPSEDSGPALSAQGPPGAEPGPDGDVARAQSAPRQAPGEPDQPSAGPPDDEMLVGLRAASELHLSGIDLTALRNARAKDPDFPDPAKRDGRDALYRLGELRRWSRNRVREDGEQEWDEEDEN
ncbi:pRL2-11 [Streptomyces sp. H10-C2]|uniref:pRL2-11 n=1 Tax=unclassified Streptomyces TaxID=2593676 RepID=UPI0024B957EC|nr:MULTISPECIES: pRL2-11 [unclassified Streptomyces]MDJ0346964.1 pRL2-11 [Streptomyces sp. PH10-H1]MDJ0374629.1 pRL2-11 [Streptomyces sp. H10-C2]